MEGDNDVPFAKQGTAGGAGWLTVGVSENVTVPKTHDIEVIAARNVRF
jgi:hypothetical protein